MGGCYSSDSECAVASPLHKLPVDRLPGHSHKGLQYSLLTNGDYQHQEDEALQQSTLSGSAGLAVSRGDSQLLPEHAQKTKGVAPSDSGIESIGPSTEESHCGVVEKEASLCQSCHNQLKRLSLGSCEQCGQFRFDVSELNSLVDDDTYCTCASGQGGFQPDYQLPSTRTKASPSHSPKRHSDIPSRQLKSNLKKEGQEKRDGKHVRMSWKSADSVDLASSMNTCMDRTKSEASDVFGDDVSFRAPLAHFDSVDHRLDVAVNADEEEGDSHFLTSRMSIYSEILELTDSICHCDISKAAVEQEQRPAPQRSVSEDDSQPSCRTLTCSPPEEEDWPDGHLGKSTDGDPLGVGEVEDVSPRALHSSLLGCAAVQALEKMSTECQEALCPVSVVVKGRQMVLMEASTYSQVLSDVHMLRHQLQLLAQVIQGQEEA